MTSKTQFEAVNRIGRVVMTFDGLDARKRAIAWAKANSRDHDGLTVEEVTVTTIRRRVYRPNPPERRVFGTISQGAMA